MKINKYVIIGVLLIANKAIASPRTEYLSSKVQEAYAIEIQAKAKFRASEDRYNSAKNYTKALRRELAQVSKREAREDKAVRAAARAEYGHVNSYMLGDMTAPVSARLR